MNIFRRYDVTHVTNPHGTVSTVVTDRWRRTSSRFTFQMQRDVAIAWLKALRAECALNRRRA